MVAVLDQCPGPGEVVGQLVFAREAEADAAPAGRGQSGQITHPHHPAAAAIGLAHKPTVAEDADFLTIDLVALRSDLRAADQCGNVHGGGRDGGAEPGEIAVCPGLRPVH